jgi:hypothetical protein
MNEKNSEQGDEVQDQGRKLRDQVEEHLSKGDKTSAKRAFSRSWRDAVPDLPLRFSVILVKTDPEAIEGVAKKMRQGKKAPKLRLVHTRSGSWEVRATRTLGSLPAPDGKLLTELGASSRLYRPELLEIRSDEKGDFDYIAVELVRPETNFCSSCGKEHKGEHENCSDCRALRRRKGEEKTEQTAVGFHEAVDAITLDTDLPI